MSSRVLEKGERTVLRTGNLLLKEKRGWGSGTFGGKMSDKHTQTNEIVGVYSP